MRWKERGACGDLAETDLSCPAIRSSYFANLSSLTPLIERRVVIRSINLGTKPDELHVRLPDPTMRS